MLQNDKKLAFVELGKFLSQFTQNETFKNKQVLNNDLFFDDFLALIELSQSHNGWFTQEQVCFSIQSWAEALTEENLNQWLLSYDFSTVKPKTVALILAGNIPLVGFHDWLCIFLSGHYAFVKPSSKNTVLMRLTMKFSISFTNVGLLRRNFSGK